MEQKKRALIAMSGGVDSSVAVHLMQQQGYECVGATMRLYEPQHCEDGTCGSSSAVEDARKVAEHHGIAFHALDYRKDFEKEVLCRFVETYEAGGTPNPCVECNHYMKFGRLMQKMEEAGCECIVTGHYVRVEYEEKYKQRVLKKGLDESKDQSYVLYNLTKEQLEHCEFPLGGYSKDKIRELAEELGLFNAGKKDSQDICFVPDGDYAGFIESYTGKTYEEGNFVTKDGEVLGRHKGMIRYTIGQRKGLGLSLKEPMYVCEKRMDTNEVVLCLNEELFGNYLEAEAVNWMVPVSVGERVSCKAKARYKQKEADAVVEIMDDNLAKVTFAEPQRGITKGQSVVFYDGDIVLGGGVIM